MAFKYLILLLFSVTTAFAGLQFERVLEIPETLRSSMLTNDIRGGDLTQDLNFSKIEFAQNGRERFSIAVPSTENIFEQNMPIVPSYRKFVPKKAGFVAEVLLRADHVEKSVGPVPLERTPLPFVWGDLSFFPVPKEEGIFPGSFLRVSSTGGGSFAHVYPVQQDLKTGELFILRRATLWVRYLAADVTVVPIDRWSKDPTSIILTSRVLQSSAEKLRAFHRETSGSNTQLVYVEDLATAPMISEEELPDGYKNGEDKDASIVPYDPSSKSGYHYELAKKIIYYLHQIIHRKGNLRYVTLLGNSQLIPPSYYFTLPAVFGKKWGVTDQCYGSLKGCLEPRLAVGRLPFSTDTEVENYLIKASRYYRKQRAPQKELSLLGGKAFPNAEIYVGELGTLRVIQDPKTDWLGVNKVFRTKYNYERKSVLGLASGAGETRFVYALDHGKGNQWFVEHEFVSSEDIHKTVSVEEPNHPVVVSIACSNGSFDEELNKEPIFGSAQHGKESIGNSLLRSKGGPIAYWGEARPGVGNPVYDLDLNGNLNLSGSTYGLQMLEGFFEKYRGLRKGKIGDVILQAQHAFAIERGNNMKEQGNAWTYYITTLLGDPFLELPSRPEEIVENAPLGTSRTLFEKSTDLPVFYFENPVTLNVGFSSPTPVDATLFKWVESEFGSFMSEKVVAEKKAVSGEAALDVELLPEDSYGTYFMRLENTRGVPREQQVWFKAKPRL